MFPDKFDSDKHLKRAIAMSFWTDANDLLWKVDIIKKSKDFQFNRSFKAKIFVDILMSTECSLKSLIISLSKDDETPEIAYQEARYCGHDLDKLLAKVETRSKYRLKFISNSKKKILHEANDLGVFTRYDLDLFFMVFNDDFFKHKMGTGKISSTIKSLSWLDDFMKVSYKVKSIASKSVERYFKNHQGLRGDKLSERDRRFNEFASNTGFSNH